MGQIDGFVDPEIEAMQNMIHGALDASFEERNRAKEGARRVPERPSPELCVASVERARGAVAEVAESSFWDEMIGVHICSTHFRLPPFHSRQHVLRRHVLQRAVGAEEHVYFQAVRCSHRR